MLLLMMLLLMMEDTSGWNIKTAKIAFATLFASLSRGNGSVAADGAATAAAAPSVSCSDCRTGHVPGPVGFGRLPSCYFIMKASQSMSNTPRSFRDGHEEMSVVVVGMCCARPIS